MTEPVGNHHLMTIELLWALENVRKQHSTSGIGRFNESFYSFTFTLHTSGITLTGTLRPFSDAAIHAAH